MAQSVTQIETKRNNAFYLAFPMAGNAGTFVTGLSPVDDAYYKDADGAWTSLAIDDAASEIGSTGVYELNLSAVEMNHDRIFIKLTETGVDDIGILLTTEGIRLADGVEHGGTLGSSTATLAFEEVNVTNTDGNAVTLVANGHGINIATTDGHGIYVAADGVGRIGFSIQSDDNVGIFVQSGGNSAAMRLNSPEGPGVAVIAEKTCIDLAGNTGSGIYIYSGAETDDYAGGLFIESDNNPAIRGRVADGDGVHIVASGTGINISSDAGLPLNIPTTEPAGVPAWGDSLTTFLAWMGAMSRNKIIQSSDTQTLRNDADDADIATSAIDAGPPVVRGEWS